MTINVKSTSDGTSDDSRREERHVLGSILLFMSIGVSVCPDCNQVANA